MKLDNDGNVVVVGQASSQNTDNGLVMKFNYITTKVDGHNAPQTELTCYPNPTNGIININIPEGYGRYRIFISNIFGEVLPMTYTTKQTIDCSGFEKGIYFIHFVSEKHNHLEKIIIR